MDLDFVNLHNHSEYSLLDGLATVEEMVLRVKEVGQTAIAITDHGTISGAVQMYKVAHKHGVKPIIGNELYITDSVEVKERSGIFHLTTLAMNNVGLENLYKLSSIGYDHFYYKPRIDIDILSSHSAGLIVTTGCMGAPIPKAIAVGDIKTAEKLMSIFLDIFGKDRYFIELQEHAGIKELSDINRQLYIMAKKFGLSNNFLATNDAHYAGPNDAIPHDQILCIQTGSKLSDKDRMRFSDAEYYLKTAEEMYTIFHEIPTSLTNTLRVAEMCNVTLDTGDKMPDPFEDSVGMLRSVVEPLATTQDEVDRVQHELKIIERMGFSSYFMVIREICNLARQNDIWWNTRGSAAGSLVAHYCGITQIPPLENGLIFERFLNPTRVNMPDIDLDIEYDRRSELVTLTLERFGAEKFASIITFGKFGGKSSIKDAARIIGADPLLAGRLTKNINGLQSNEATAVSSITTSHQFFSQDNYDAYKTDPVVKQLFDIAINLDGRIRHSGVHPCGVVMTSDDIRNHLPTQRTPKGVPGLGGLEQMTQFDMADIDYLNFLKIDYLGLKTLSIIKHVCELIEKNHGVHYDMSNIPYEAHHVGPDPSKKAVALFELLQNGDVAGVFQVEGDGMASLMLDMQPYDYQHIVAAVALFRPGPMDNIPTFIARMHGEPFEYAHPDLEPILSDTYGIMVYQEQIIEVAVKIAGYEAGGADQIRKAVGKKIKEQLDAHKEKFITGCVDNGYELSVGESIWADIEFFARYGFNRAHAASYGMITCMTAFLKAHYRDEYLTALLTNEAKNTDKIASYASKMGLSISQPDIQLGNLQFMVNDNSVAYGLASIKNTQLAILSEIAEAAPFTSLGDLISKVDVSGGKKTLESLILSGAMDCFGSRSGMIRIVPEMQRQSKLAKSGQRSLFGFDALLTVPDMKYDAAEYAIKQRDLTGIYFDHPTSSHNTGTTIAKLVDAQNGSNYNLAVMIDSAIISLSKKGNRYIYGVVSDSTGSIRFMSYGDNTDLINGLHEDNPNDVYMVSIKINEWNGKNNIVINTIRQV
jgi:DNA polymerase-3 subunit alpha